MAANRQYFSTSLEKGLKILSVFNRDRTSISQSEISKILGLNMTSTYRYINTFVELGYLEKDKTTKRLRPGMKCVSLCTNLMQATNQMRLIRNLVDAYYQKHNITIDVGVVDNDTVMRIYRREAEETLTYNLPERAVNCLHNTSTGKAYLSTLNGRELATTIERIELAPKTVNTITDKVRLHEEIKKTKVRGYSMCVEEYLPGLITIGAPVVNSENGECLGTVSFDFSVLQNSSEEVEKVYAQLVMELARELSETFPEH